MKVDADTGSQKGPTDVVSSIAGFMASLIGAIMMLFLSSAKQKFQGAKYGIK